MIVTAWNNGNRASSGAGYGLKLRQNDLGKFNRAWGAVRLHLPGNSEATNVNIDKDSFWNETCRELIHKEIGVWLIENGFREWPKGKPPKFELCEMSRGTFELVVPTQ